MSAAHLVSTCAACGAEESLDSLLQRMIDDDEVRRLIADVVTKSLPLGGLVVRYLRLHKPARQKLRMSRVAQLLGELVPDMRRSAITRKGREWQAPAEAWKAALQSVFEAGEKGTLTLPLDGNAYLYEILMRMADKAEATAEREQQQAGRSRTHSGGAQSLGELLAHAPVPREGTQTAPEAAQVAEVGPSPTARRIQAEIRQKLAARQQAAEPPATSS